MQDGSSHDDALKPPEKINLFSDHTAHITLYLADFDLEANTQQHTDDINTTTATAKALNQTKVNAFKKTISSLNFTSVVTGMDCHLSFTQSPSSADADIQYYKINGSYTMLLISNTPCLQRLSNTLLNALQVYIKHPVRVPTWVANLPEPQRSAAIYRTRQYGSPNIMEAYVPHVSVGYDPGIKMKASATDWRIDIMKQWNDIYTQIHDECNMDNVQGIALGKNSVGGTVLADSRMGYWDIKVNSARSGKANEADKSTADGFYALVY